jgi:hypothetical protein
VITLRLSIGPQPRFFTAAEFETVAAIANCIVPQPTTRPPIPVAALVDYKLHEGRSDGYRPTGMPRQADAWRHGLEALNAESKDAYRECFSRICASDQIALLHKMKSGDLKSAAWGTLRPSEFFKKRMAHDIVYAYYAHPTAWSEIGWGGPASPRGYVRLDFDERDSWEAAEARPGDETSAYRINRHVR